MRREETFVQSHRPYAVRLDSLKEYPSTTGGVGMWVMHAVWFRRRKGITVACIGTLWDFQKIAPTTPQEFLERHDDGRHGGSTRGRWDGHGYWGDGVSLDVQEAHLTILQPMLAAWPQVPEGYDGWWTFQ